MKSNTAELMLVNHSLDHNSSMIDKHQDSAEIRNKGSLSLSGNFHAGPVEGSPTDRVLPDLPQNKKPNQLSVLPVMQPILSQLRQQCQESHFWKHEFEKHGPESK